MNRYSKALRILSPKGQVEDKPLMAVKIVKGEYYSRPVMEKEIQEYIQKTFKKSNQYRYRKDNWLETLVEEKEIEFDRKEIEKEIKLRRLYEQMTTKGMMVTTISGEGETDLDSLDGSVAASYSPLSGESSAFSNTALTASGTGSGSDGGFNLGQDYLAFNGGSEYQVRYAALDAIDSTEIDTIVITAIRGNDANGGEDPDAENEDLTVWYQIGDGAPTKIGIIIPVGSDDSGLKNWSLAIPAAAQNAATKFILRQETHHGVGFDNYGVTEIKFQRRAPMNVFVSLDSPEASAFIRTGGDEEKDKKKKVQEILDGSDAYLENQFGEDFPGTSPREVGQEEPQPGIGKFEPEVIDYETWKNELEKSDDPEAKKILKGDPKKTFNAFVDDNPELAAQSVLNDILNGKSVENQLSQLPQEVQDIIISKTVESILIGEVNVELSQLPPEVQDVLITNPEYMTNERIDNLINDEKLLGDVLSSMWEMDEKLFNSVTTEVEELPYHQQINELKNILSGTKYKGDEGFVDYGIKSGQVLSNMSQLDQNRYGPVLELLQSFYGLRDSDAPSDWRFNYAYGRDIVNGEFVTPPSAEGSPYHTIYDEYETASKETDTYYDDGENALENREDYKEYEKAKDDFLNFNKKIGGIRTDKDGNPDPDGYYYKVSISTFKGSDWVKDRAKWHSLFNKSDNLWSSSYGSWQKEASAALAKESKLRNERDAMKEAHTKKVDALRARLDAEYNRNKAKIEKAVEGSWDIFAQDFMKMFIMQYSGNMSSNYSFGGPDLPDILPSTTADDSKPSSEPWSMDIQVGDDRIIKTGEGQSSTTVLDTQRGIDNTKQLSGSVGKTAGVDAATAASTAAQTQRDKDKDKNKDKNKDKRKTYDQMNSSEKADFDAKMAELDAEIKKHGDAVKAAHAEMRNIAIWFGIDVVTTIFGGALLKGGAAAIKALRGYNALSKVQKADKLLKGASTMSKVGASSSSLSTAVGNSAGAMVSRLTGDTSSKARTARNAILAAMDTGSDDAVKLAVKNAEISLYGKTASQAISSSPSQILSGMKPGETLKIPGKTRGLDIKADKNTLKKMLENPSDYVKDPKKQQELVNFIKKAFDYAESYKPQGNPLMEKKKFDAVEPKEHKSGSKRIKSPKQFFNSADVKPEFPKDPPP